MTATGWRTARGRLAAGVFVALLIAAGTVPAAQQPVSLAPPIRAWVWQVDPALLWAARDTYLDLLRAIPRDAQIFVAAESDAVVLQAAEALGLADEPDPRVHFVRTGTPLTAWARDRYLLVGRQAILPPDATVETGRRGDLFVPYAASEALDLKIRSGGLIFEGGDVIVGPRRIFVGAGTAEANRPSALEGLGRRLNREVVVLGGGETASPHGHLDMFVAIVDQRRAVVGDPLLALPHLEDPATREALVDLGIFTPALQRAYAPGYREVARHLRDLGYTVVRVPALHAADGETVVTWTNAVVEARAGRLRAYVPSYGIPGLDRAALQAWRRHVADVFPIRSRGVIREGGAVRCLTNAVLPRPALAAAESGG